MNHTGAIYNSLRPGHLKWHEADKESRNSGASHEFSKEGAMDALPEFNHSNLASPEMTALSFWYRGEAENIERAAEMLESGDIKLFKLILDRHYYKIKQVIDKYPDAYPYITDYKPQDKNAQIPEQLLIDFKRHPVIESASWVALGYSVYLVSHQLWMMASGIFLAAMIGSKALKDISDSRSAKREIQALTSGSELEDKVLKALLSIKKLADDAGVPEEYRDEHLKAQLPSHIEELRTEARAIREAQGADSLPLS